MRGCQSISSTAYFVLYCFIFLVYGLEGGSIGPVIPYLSKQRDREETSYSFLFTARTVGSIVGFALYKFIQRMKYQHFEHKIIVIWGLTNCVFMVIFIQWEQRIWEFMSLAFFGGGHYGALTVANICVLSLSQQKAGVWVILVNALFGVGALVAPLIIRYMSVASYYVYALLYFLVCFICLIIPTPMEQNQKQLKQQKHNSKNNFVRASKQLQLLIGLGLFLIAGLQLTVSGWIPSYAVIMKILNQRQATIYGSLFWGVSTIFRFIAAGITMKNTLKLKSLLMAVFLCSITCFVLHQVGAYSAAALVGSLCYGMACSAVFPLLVSISIDYKIQFGSDQISNMMIAPVLSSMCIAGLTGTLMHKKIDMLFYSLLFMSALLLLDAWFFFREMNKGLKDRQFKMISIKEEIQTQKVGLK